MNPFLLVPFAYEFLDSGYRAESFRAASVPTNDKFYSLFTIVLLIFKVS